MRDVITMIKSCKPSVEGETESEREGPTIEKCIKGMRREMDCPLFPSPLHLPSYLSLLMIIFALRGWRAINTKKMMMNKGTKHGGRGKVCAG